jgi:hypothetical protein
MSIPFLQAINLSQNELQNARIQNLASDPGSPVVGQIWYNTTTGVLKYYDGAIRVFAGLQNKLTDFVAPTSSISMGSQLVQNVATPVSSTDAANKAYVDNVALGLDVKASVKCATTASGTLASSFANGQLVDGITLVTGDRILIKNQASPSDNGIYTVSASGAPTRSTDCNSTTNYLTGSFTFIEEGTVNAGASYVVQTQGTITPGVTSVSWVQFSGGASSSATNLAGGSANAIIYQSAASTTNFLAGNTAATDQVLVSHGTGSAANAPTLTNAPALSAANMTSFPTVSNATSAVNFSGSLSGDVTGTQGATSVVKVNGLAIPVSAALLASNSSSQLTAVTTVPTGTMPALTGDVTSTSGTVATTVVKINGVSMAGLATGILKNTTGTGVPSIASAGTDYVVPSGSITGSSGSFTGSLVGDVTGTQGATSVAKINGVTLPTLAAATGILYDTAGVLSLAATLPTAAEPAHTGDVTNTAGSLGMTVKGINGTLLSGLASGLLYNTTTTGVPTIATAAQVVAVISTTAVANATAAVSATTATNLAGTTSFAVPYQSGSATTGYVSPNTTGSTDAVLTSTSTSGVAAAPTFKNAPALSAANMTSFPTLNQSTSGTAAGLSVTLAVGSGGTNATTAAGARTNLGATGKYAATFGDGSTTSYVITHSLGTNDVIVGVYYVATPFQVVQCEVQLTSTNTITLVFAVAPASNSLRVVVIG